jgi:hypothetical protein
MIEFTEEMLEKHRSLLDMSGVSLQAAFLDDIENVRKGNASRYGALTGFTPDGQRWKPDKDGENRSFGLSPAAPQAVAFRAQLMNLAELEAAAILALERTMKAHPLGRWVAAQRGLGMKQAGRLLAAIGDPYWRRELVYLAEDGETVLRTVPEGPRGLRSLVRYCGRHVVLEEVTTTSGADSSVPDSHSTDLGAGPDKAAGGNAPEGPGDHIGWIGVAARRRKGVRTTWSVVAGMRLWNCAASCVKQLAKPCAASEIEGENWAIHVEAECKCSPYRVAYDVRKAHTATAWKGRDKVTDLHRHNDALRIAGKTILKGLWREARRLHLAIDPALAGDEGLPEQHPDAVH